MLYFDYQDMDELEAELTIPTADDLSDDELQSSERIRRPTLPLSKQWCKVKETPKETDFHKSARLCLERIRESLFQHQWEEAVEYMISFFQMLEDTSTAKQLVACEIIWRLGTEILHHHPNSKLEDFNSFFEQMKNTGMKSYLLICLEHSFHLLLNGHFDDAKRQLSIAESWRFGKQSASQAERVKLVHAYRGFLDYVTWSTKKSNASGADDSDVGANQEMHSYFRQASVNLGEIIKQPGVWDPFVISYVNMLEFYNDQDGALNVLNEYAHNSSFPPNPNSHIYLYLYLKRHAAPKKKLIKVLRDLQALVPSHELMLELCSLLLLSEKDKHLQEALTVIFDLLDYSSWKDNLDAWDCFRDVIKLLRKKKLKHLIVEEWKKRQDWWPAFHFRTDQARINFRESEELITVKAVVAAALAGNKCRYCRRKVELFKTKEPKTKPPQTKRCKKPKRTLRSIVRRKRLQPTEEQCTIKKQLHQS